MSSASTVDKTILVIEDDPDIRATIAEVFEEEGYAVISTNDGAEGLACLRDAKQLPDVIILDLMMPVMDGIAFREEQRKNSAWIDIPVIVLSADRTSGDKAAAMGARGCFQKPFDIEQLLELVRAIDKQPDVR